MLRLSTRSACLAFVGLFAVQGAVHAQDASRRRPAQTHSQPAAPPPSQPAATQAPPPNPNATQARALFQEGQAAYTAGNYEGAVARWEEAFALDPRPQLQYNLAQAYGRLGQLDKELAALQRFVEGGLGDPATLDAARLRIAAVQDRLARTGLRLTGGPEGAAVRIDGEARGTLPMQEAVHLEAGQHHIEVRLRGYYPRNVDALVELGEVTAVNVDMQAVHQPSNTLPIALWATGGGALLTGAVLGGVALSKAKSAAPGSSEADTAQGLALGADICLGVGVAAAVTGTVLFFVRRVDVDEVSQARLDVQPIVGVGTAGLSLRGGF